MTLDPSRPSGTPSPIFREKALERLVSPEHLDQLMQVTTPKGWLALLALGSLVAVAVLWGIFGTLTSSVTGQGILTRAGGLTRVISLVPGQVRELYVEAGAVVQEGQVVASLIHQDESGRTVRAEVTSPQAGRVLAIMAGKGDFVDRGAPLLSIEPLDKSLELVIYMPLATGKNLRAGMEVQIMPSTVRKEEYGFLRGVVRSVADFPATAQSMKHVLGTDELVQAFSTAGAPIEIHVDLAHDPNSASGYQWSSPKDPPVELTSGTLCSATIILGRRRPISQVIPIAGR